MLKISESAFLGLGTFIAGADCTLSINCWFLDEVAAFH